MHRVSKLIAGLGVLFGLSITVTEALAQAAAPDLPNDIRVTFAGANAIGGRMTREVAAAWAAKLGLTNVRINAGSDPDQYEVTADKAESPRKMRISVSAKGQGTGLEPMLQGQADFWMAARQVRESDLDAVRKKNTVAVPGLQQFITPGIENLVGLDPLSILVNAHNPVNALSFQQVKDMYSGKVTNWSQMGGANLAVGLYVLEPVIVITPTFCASVLGMPDVQKCLDSMPRLAAPRATIFEEMSDGVASNPGGLGYLSLAERKNARAVPIGSDCGQAIEPSPFRVKTDEYPLIRRLYLYANPVKPLSPSARAYLAFMLSNEGQAAVAKSGFADLVPGLSPRDYAADRVDHVSDAMDRGRTHVRPSDARAFEEAIGSAERLSITFRFQAGSTELDSRSDADVGRLAQLMQQPDYQSKRVVLVGFSSASGDYSEGRVLSRQRADAVRDRLVSQSHLKDVTSVGIGPGAAVVCNLDPSITALNQRVEVWLR
jgi:phosphate transport system substrate-binding protein